ncbi:MAG: hypothetical protein K0Q78_2458 [Cellvibrio sp.]|jgi:hypothetical protein|nr:hypothetical protein [Cellvibrio sp.]
MRVLNLWQSVIAILVLSACTTTPKVHSDFDRNANFSSFRTFAFVDTLATDRSGYSTLITGYFKSAVEREMVGLGYTLTNSNPDLLVNFTTNSEARTDVRSTGYSGYSGYYGYRYGMYSGFPSNDVSTVHYKVGTVTIDVVDARKKQLVWEGTTEGKLTKEVMENPQAAVNTAVSNIFAQYPTRQPPAK